MIARSLIVAVPVAVERKDVSKMWNISFRLLSRHFSNVRKDDLSETDKMKRQIKQSLLQISKLAKNNHLGFYFTLNSSRKIHSYYKNHQIFFLHPKELGICTGLRTS
jgi:hypothetical protein